MALADLYYRELIEKVLEEGVSDETGEVRPVFHDGTPAYSYSIFGEQVQFPKGEVPIITMKRTPVQSSINEVVIAFFQQQTNKITDFKNLKIGYWDEWELEDGTIGDSYGAQLANQKYTLPSGKQINQVEFIIRELSQNPFSRRIMFSYWDTESRKALQECAWAGQFNVRPSTDSDNLQLDFLLIQRSVDLLHGLPSNWAGYYALQGTLASLLGFDVGTFTHQMGNVHLYKNQVEVVREMVENGVVYDAPKLYVNPYVKSFYDYLPEDIRYENYQHGGAYRVEVAK